MRGPDAEVGALADPLPAGAALVQRITKAVRSLRSGPSVRTLREEVERLAEVSPHLLADLGFEEIGIADPSLRAWRRGELMVMVVRSADCVPSAICVVGMEGRRLVECLGGFERGTSRKDA